MSVHLVRYEEARRALAECSRVDDVKDIRDKAAALEAYARQRSDVELERWVAEIKLRATRRIGELSRDLEKAPRGGLGGTSKLPNGGKNAVLKAAGISTSAAHRAEQLATIPEKQFEEYIAKRTAAGRPVTFDDAIAAVSRQQRDDDRRSDLQRPVASDLPAGLHHGDFRQIAESIADESVELIFTDPPYDRDSVILYVDAARIAARILKPGGSLIAYCGQYILPEILAGMSEHLRFWWVNACLHSGSHARMREYGIVVNWKPMVWFVKGSRGDKQTFVDDLVSGGREKSHHEWQQSEAEAAYYIEKLTSHQGLVVDFFCGGGTTAVAAQSLGRPWLACEINPATLVRAADRLTRMEAA